MSGRRKDSALSLIDTLLLFFLYRDWSILRHLPSNCQKKAKDFLLLWVIWSIIGIGYCGWKGFVLTEIEGKAIFYCKGSQIFFCTNLPMSSISLRSQYSA